MNDPAAVIANLGRVSKCTGVGVGIHVRFNALLVNYQVCPKEVLTYLLRRRDLHIFPSRYKAIHGDTIFGAPCKATKQLLICT